MKKIVFYSSYYALLISKSFSVLTTRFVELLEQICFLKMNNELDIFWGLVKIQNNTLNKLSTSTYWLLNQNKKFNFNLKPLSSTTYGVDSYHNT